MALMNEEFKDFEDISKNSDRGILKKVFKESTSLQKPCHKDTCLVRYRGTYIGGDEDGKEFDRSDDFSFQLGCGKVIQAWDICVATMKIGEECILVASTENCYNDGKAMKFEITLISCEGEDISEKKDRSILKSVLEEGDGLFNPPYGVEAKISYRSTTDPNAKFIEKTYIVGDAESSDIPPGLDVTVRSMTHKELSRVQMKEKAKGDVLNSYEIRLLSFEKLKHLSSFPNFEEQMKYAEILKNKANNYLKISKYFLAVKIYDRLTSDLEYLTTNGPEEHKTLEAFKVVVYNNCALAHLKLKDVDTSIQTSNKALKIDFKSEKALFRLGQAYLELNDHEEAERHFKNCHHYHQNNVEAAKMRQFCQNRIAQAKQVEKARFRGIFNRLKDTGLGLPDEPEHKDIKDHCGREDCDSGAESSDSEKADAEAINETA